MEQPHQTFEEKHSRKTPRGMQMMRFILVVIIALLIGYSVGVNKITLDWQNYKPHIEVTSKEPPSGIIRLDLTSFWNVLDKVETFYYDKTKIDSQKILNGAISGMVASLDDPYTMYLPSEPNIQFKNALAGKFEGIGAELGLKGKQIIVISPLDGSPAQKAGVKPGDMIIKVDNQLTYGWTLNQAVEKIRGTKGTPVILSIVRKAGESAKDIKVIRDEIKVKSVSSWKKKIKDIDEIHVSNILKPLSGNEVLYVRVSQFGDSTNDEWVEAINALNVQLSDKGEIKGIVLDLRNNPGGYLAHAQFIASEFLPIGKKVVIQESGIGNREELLVKRNGLLLNMPLVVLINKGSASASEIVAGALHDQKRAKLVGETSFGKGTIQTAEDLGDGSGLHITIAKWLTPNGTWIHNDGVPPDGIDPDVKVDVDKNDQSHDLQLEKAIETLVQ